MMSRVRVSDDSHILCGDNNRCRMSVVTDILCVITMTSSMSVVTYCV